MFVEDRQDLTVEWQPGSPQFVSWTRTHGACLRHRSGFGWRESFRAAPTVDQLSNWAPGSTADLQDDPDAAAVVSPESAPVAPVELLERVGRALARAGYDRHARVDYAAFDQQVFVAAHDRAAQADRRSSAWLRVTVAGRDSGAGDRAVFETTCRPESEPLGPADLEQRLAAALSRVEELAGARVVEPGERAVVLASGLGGIVAHELIGHPLEADAVQAGRSWLRLLEDRPVGSWSVIDDPRRSRAAWKIDDEGTPSRVVPLLSRGRVGGRLESRATSSDGRQPTGHARRATYRDPLLPRMGCTFVAPGEFSQDEVVRQAGEAIHVRRMAAAHVDPTVGVAWFRVTDADLLCNGESIHPLKPFMICIRGEALLGLDLRVANDLRFDVALGSCHKEGQTMAMSVGAPTIWIGVHRVIA